MSDGFTLNRQPCRCGNVFADYVSYQAHQVWDGNTLVECHDPVVFGMRKTEAGEWTGIPVSESVDKPAVKPRAAGARAETRGTRECKLSTCSNTFDLPNRRGRPPVYCPDHRK